MSLSPVDPNRSLSFPLHGTEPANKSNQDVQVVALQALFTVQSTRRGTYKATHGRSQLDCKEFLCEKCKALLNEANFSTEESARLATIENCVDQNDANQALLNFYIEKIAAQCLSINQQMLSFIARQIVSAEEKKHLQGAWNIFTSLDARRQMIISFSEQIEAELCAFQQRHEIRFSSNQVPKPLGRTNNSLREQIFNEVSKNIGSQLLISFKDHQENLLSSFEKTVFALPSDSLEKGRSLASVDLFQEFYGKIDETDTYIQAQNIALFSRLESYMQFPSTLFYNESTASEKLRKEAELDQYYEEVGEKIQAIVQFFKKDFVEELMKNVLIKCLERINASKAQTEWQEKNGIQLLPNCSYVLDTIAELMKSNLAYRDFCVLLNHNPLRKAHFLSRLQEEIQPLLPSDSILTPTNLECCFSMSTTS